MNKKGFAITTIVYAIVILLVLLLFLAISILKSSYNDQREFVKEIDSELTACLEKKMC